MNIERKLVDALERNDLIKIEKLFNDIYNSNYKLVYFCVANLIKNKEGLIITSACIGGILGKPWMNKNISEIFDMHFFVW